MGFTIQMFMEHFEQDYQDAIGTRPVQLIIKEVKEQLEKGNITPTQVSRALQQTAYAPRPSWAYAYTWRSNVSTSSAPFANP